MLIISSLALLSAIFCIASYYLKLVLLLFCGEVVQLVISESLKSNRQATFCLHYTLELFTPNHWSGLKTFWNQKCRDDPHTKHPFDLERWKGKNGKYQSSHSLDLSSLYY